MKIEVWSDVACPFCFIGKAHLEKALSSFGNDKDIDVTYKSYQLDPDYLHKDGDTVYSYLGHRKLMEENQVKEMAGRITEFASQAGITMHFEKNVPANTWDAHRLIHLAEQENCDKEVVEALFEAYFTNGENVEKKEVLKNIGLQVGISAEKIDELLSSDKFAYEVKQDILDSRNLGIQGVPFFVFDDKYAISGAQPVEVFEETLQKSFQEWRKENPAFINVSDSKGGICTDGICEV